MQVLTLDACKGKGSKQFHYVKGVYNSSTGSLAPSMLTDYLSLSKKYLAMFKLLKKGEMLFLIKNRISKRCICGSGTTTLVLCTVDVVK